MSVFVLQLILDKRVLEILVALSKRAEAPLRLNGAWGLMVCILSLLEVY